jgi:hypothetical protein
LTAVVQTLLGDTAPEPGGPEVGGFRAAAGSDAEAARELYRQAFEEARAPVRRARLALALGMLAVDCADRIEAVRWLHLAQELALALGLPEVHWRALLARGRAFAELEGDDHQARLCFEEAVLISEVQARKLRHRTDAAAYHLHRAGVLRQLLRAACRRGDAAAAFRYQELDRGRLLLELWRGASRQPGRTPLADTPELADLDREIDACERELEAQSPVLTEPLWRRREELLLQRDRLFEDFLRDRSRRPGAILPALLELPELAQLVRAGTVYVAPSLLEDDVYFLVVRPGQGGSVLRAQGQAAAVREQLNGFRRTVAAQMERYRRGFPIGRAERADLDHCLTALGHGPLGSSLGQILSAGERLIWAPDEDLHGLPVHALRRRGCYLVENHEVVSTFGGALFAQQAAAPRRSWWRQGPALVVTESAEVLPTAQREGEGVAATFLRSRLLHGALATRAVLRRALPRAAAVHFACHAYFDVLHPLAAAIGLPSGETWRALEWLDQPVNGLPLVTLSACRSAEVAPLVGREVFGLVTGILGSGVRAVLAGLWPVADRETLPLMWQFYRQRMSGDLATALAQAQRQALALPGSSPLFWAAFALFGDATALPAPGPIGRWWARRRQRSHARRFPISVNQPLQGACP